ncbi:hypothetical protein JW859_11820 [bacterium]|nr:hypothetical protein [bacterium]
MKKIVGYMEGADPLWLTTLQLLGYDTLPLSNGQDGHGLNIQLIMHGNRPDLVICWPHKLLYPGESDISPRDLLHATTLFEIPVLVACPLEFQTAAVNLLGDLPANVRLVDPGEILAKAREMLARN